VISLDRNYYGTDLRWSTKARLGEMPFGLVAGLAYDALDETRRGYQNFVDTTLGVKGELRRDERNDVYNFDQYLQASLQFSPRWSANAGVRHCQGALRVERPLRRRHQSRRQRQRQLLRHPAGARRDVRRQRQRPSLCHRRPRLRDADAERARLPAERRDRPQPGPAAGAQQEPGGRRQVPLRAGAEATVAAFETRTEDEIVTQTNAGGRSTFQNAGSTRRRGIELSATAELVADLRVQGAYTWLDAKYRESFLTCAGVPCTTPTLRSRPATAFPASPPTRSTPPSPGRRRRAGAPASRPGR
jgi:iron complex outermembrane receptor protein